MQAADGKFYKTGSFVDGEGTDAGMNCHRLGVYDFATGIPRRRHYGIM